MKRLNLTHTLAILIGIAAMCFQGIAAEDTAEMVTFAGRVVDVEGQPMPGFVFAIQGANMYQQQVDITTRYAMSDPGVEQDSMLPPVFVPVETDEAGTFSITEGIAGKVQLVVRHNIAEPPKVGTFDKKPAHAIVSIDIGGIIFYPNPGHRYSSSTGLTFSLKPGARFENVEVTVQPRTRVRAKIVFKDGTPLANAQVIAETANQDLRGLTRESSKGARRTDAEGYIAEYPKESSIFTILVTYQGLASTSETITVKAGERHEIVLTFDSEPIAGMPVGQPPLELEIEPPGAPKTAEIPLEDLPPPAARHTHGTDINQVWNEKAVWVVNPANGHAYKQVYCGNWDEAESFAIAEEAHLVAINDEAEQKWLEGAFKTDGFRHFWIGLTDVEKEGEWRWTSGEPVTYTNWASAAPFPDELDASEKDYVTMGFLGGKWVAVGELGETGPYIHPHFAILERDGLLSKTPVKATEEGKSSGIEDR